MILSHLATELKKAEDHLRNEFARLQVGRANPAIVEGIHISVYGSTQTIRSIASVSALDGQTLSIQPYDRSILRDISKGICDANLGLNPQDNGESILIKIPPMTEDRRRDLAKMVKGISEEGRIAIRHIRQEAVKKVKNAETNKEMSEDEAKKHEADIQKAIDIEMKKIDDMVKAKEADIMKI